MLLAFSRMLYSQSDCVTAIPVCGNSNLSFTPTGPGNVLEDLGGCLVSDEHYSVWYKFTVATAGTLTFVIDSNVDPDDYDFAVYGPNVTCASFGAPIRCNYAGSNPAGVTGLTLTTPVPTYFDRHLDVLPGETYYLIVDNYSRSANGFSLSWGGTATLSSAFNDIQLAPNPFLTPGTPVNNGPSEVKTCPLPGTYNLQSLSPRILNGNRDFIVSYHYTANDALLGLNEITNPILVNGINTYYYAIHYQDPTDPLNPINECRIVGDFKFVLEGIEGVNVDLLACNDNNKGTATFNLTSANVFPSDLTAVKKYYLSLDDLNNNVNEITNPLNYVSGERTIYVKITNAGNCTAIAEIYLKFFPPFPTFDATIQSCFIENNILNGEFDLTSVSLTNLAGATYKYYLTQADAFADTNPIANPTTYISQNATIYVRVYSPDGCFNIAKIALVVIAPIKSSLLKDQVICAEGRTTLDAGPGFDAYEWSTGATTPSINGVGIGKYWVKLRTGKCITYQEVTVRATQQPVITNVDITNNTITINVNGGVGPYQYSLDGITWQESNVFTNLPRGENSVYVKDSYNCTPVNIQITVPNLINAITPNGDNVNDALDYSALAYKKNVVLTIYDRYGNKLHVSDKLRNYKWDGTSGGKKIITGTYWYTITWNENDKNNTETKYNGWILVKNRD